MSGAGAAFRGVHGPADFQAAFAVSRETFEKLETYAALLAQWQKAVQLVAPSTLVAVWGRHLADSAQLWALAPREWARWVDLGAGGGFPGLVIAIMAGSDGTRRVTLIESDSRKSAFLAEVARKTGAPVDILCARAESSSTQAKVGKVDVVSARALAPLVDLLGLAAPFWGPNTVGLFLKGRQAEVEIKGAQAKWRFEFELVASGTELDGRIVKVTKLVGITEG